MHCVYTCTLPFSDKNMAFPVGLPITVGLDGRVRLQVRDILEVALMHEDDRYDS